MPNALRYNKKHTHTQIWLCHALQHKKWCVCFFVLCLLNDKNGECAQFAGYCKKKCRQPIGLSINKTPHRNCKQNLVWPKNYWESNCLEKRVANRSSDTNAVINYKWNKNQQKTVATLGKKLYISYSDGCGLDIL